MNNEHGFLISKYDLIEHEIPTIAMGGGNVSIFGFNYNESLGCISFSENRTPNKSIGELAECVSDIEMIEKSNMLLTFSNTKSVDVLINALEFIKSEMGKYNES